MVRGARPRAGVVIPDAADRNETRYDSVEQDRTVMVRDTTDPTATMDGMPNGGTAVDGGPALEILKGQIRERDHLVAALTERLEQAAEQLDRLRRTGVDKGNRPVVGGGSGMPAELAQDHKSTLEELKRVINNWEDMQAGATLGRIETQVVELRDLISNHFQNGGSLGSATSRERPVASTASHAAPSAKSAAPSSWWERQKAAMLGDSPPAEGEPAQTSKPATSDPEGESAGGRPQVSLGDVFIPDAPPAVDFGVITLEEALQAIRDRDAIIAELRQPLLLLQAAGQLPSDLQSLDHLPEGLRTRITELEAKWESRYRPAELELSLERARLAREASQLHQQQEALQKQLKQHGLGLKDPADGSEREDGTNRRRWFRFIGKAGDDSKDSSAETK